MLTQYSFVCYSINIMRNNERENTMEVLLSKDTFMGGWRIDLVTPKGKCFMNGGIRTKKSAIAMIRSAASAASKTATIMDTRTGKVL